MAEVTFPTVGSSYDSDDFSNYGYLTLFFAMIIDLMIEIQAAVDVQGVTPGPAGSVLMSDGSAWYAGEAGISPADIEMLL